MLFLIRSFSTSGKFIQAKSRISLTPKESNLFSTLAKYLPQTELRVAGGWVRDKLLNLNSEDIDISLNNLTGTQAAEILKSNLPTISSLGVVRANPAASKHLETACIKILGFQIDLVNLRSEVYTDSRIPSITFGSPSEDAYRRDLTINSLFYNLNTDLIEDWTGFGLFDLEQKWARTPLDPRETLKDDPLRALRILRFAARFDLKICPEVENALKDPNLKDHLLKKVSRERVKIEYEKMVNGISCGPAIELIEKFEFFDIILGIDGIKVKNARSQLGEIKSGELLFEKYTAGLLLKFAPKYFCLGEKVLKISDYVGDHSLKLSKKQKEVLGKFIEFVPQIQRLSSEFDVIEAGLIIKELGDYWEEALDLLPPVLSNAFVESVKNSSLYSFNKEPPLLKVYLT